MNDSRSYFRIQRDKQNFSGSDQGGVWRRIIAVSLNNGPDPDEVGVVEAWTPPVLDDDVDTETILAIQIEAEREVFGARANAGDWIGHLFAEKLSLDPEKDAARIKAMIGMFLGAGYLRRSRHKDRAKARTRPIITRGPTTPVPPPPV